jgi:hypothetical protein
MSCAYIGLGCVGIKSSDAHMEQTGVCSEVINTFCYLYIYICLAMDCQLRQDSQMGLFAPIVNSK